jgi:hypothetical protein
MRSNDSPPGLRSHRASRRWLLSCSSGAPLARPRGIAPTLPCCARTYLVQLLQRRGKLVHCILPTCKQFQLTSSRLTGDGDAVGVRGRNEAPPSARLLQPATVPSHMHHGSDTLRSIHPHRHKGNGMAGYDEIPHYLAPNPHTDLSLCMPVDETLARLKMHTHSPGGMSSATDLQSWGLTDVVRHVLDLLLRPSSLALPAGVSFLHSISKKRSSLSAGGITKVAPVTTRQAASS